MKEVPIVLAKGTHDGILLELPSARCLCNNRVQSTLWAMPHRGLGLILDRTSDEFKQASQQSTFSPPNGRVTLSRPLQCRSKSRTTSAKLYVHVCQESCAHHAHLINDLPAPVQHALRNVYTEASTTVLSLLVLSGHLCECENPPQSALFVRSSCGLLDLEVGLILKANTVGFEFRS